MSTYKKMLILFILLILILATLFYLYKDEIADYMKWSLEESGVALEGKTLPKVSDIDETKILNTNTITESRFRILKNQVPSAFLEDKTATTTNVVNDALFFKP